MVRLLVGPGVQKLIPDDGCVSALQSRVAKKVSPSIRIGKPFISTVLLLNFNIGKGGWQKL
jgi:hypothetical protein